MAWRQILRKLVACSRQRCLPDTSERRGHACVFLGTVVLVALGLSAPAADLSLGFHRHGDGRIELSWDVLGEVQLEQRESWGGDGEWSAVLAPPVVDAGRFTLLVTPADTARFFRLRSTEPLVVPAASPADGETGVSTTREMVLSLSGPLAPSVVVGTGQAFAEVDGRRLLSRVEVAADRQTVTLFPLENVPSSARVRVTLRAAGLIDEYGREVDGDDDGVAGGDAVVEYFTASASGVPGTGVVGRVLASERGPGGVEVPLAGVTITVDGAEQTLRTTTDSSGFFQLLPAPAGRFFVHVDGRTVVDGARGIHWPDRAFYPVIGKAWEATAGIATNAAPGGGVIYLPLIPADALQAVSATESTRATLAASVLAEHPEYQGVEIIVPPNALYADNGARGGRVGIAPVPANRLPEPLPPGLDLPLVFTIQTDGAQNFSEPVAVRFPNLPDPETGMSLPPGAKSALWSFNHDSGRWELQGPMTVSADGRFVESDPGVGIRQPGWHGSRSGSTAGGGSAGGCGLNGPWVPLGKSTKFACKLVTTIGGARAAFCEQFRQACTLSCQDCVEDPVGFRLCTGACAESAGRCATTTTCPWKHGVQ